MHFERQVRFEEEAAKLQIQGEKNTSKKRLVPAPLTAFLTPHMSFLYYVEPL